MPSAQVELVKRIYEKFIQGDMEAFMSLLAPDIVVRQADSMPFGGTYKGLEEYKQLLGKIGQTWEDVQVTFERYLEEGDQVMAMLRLKARSRATGRVVDMPVAELWTVRDGKAVGNQVFYWDTAEVVRITTPAPGGA
jgi:uncharacterized protein